MGIVGVPGRGQFVCHGLVVMANWRCPEADASSRWLIVIRTNLLLPTPSMISVLCAARAIRWRMAQLAGQSDPFGTAAKTPLQLQSRANVRPQYAPRRQKRARPLGRRHGCSAPGRKPNMKSRSRSTSQAPCILCTATKPRQPQRQNRTTTSHNKTRTSRIARSNPSSRKMLPIRPIRTILTPINAAMNKSQHRAFAADGS